MKMKVTYTFFFFFFFTYTLKCLLGSEYGVIQNILKESPYVSVLGAPRRLFLWIRSSIS